MSSELWSPSSHHQEPQLTGQLKRQNHQRQGQKCLHSSLGGSWKMQVLPWNKASFLSLALFFFFQYTHPVPLRPRESLGFLTQPIKGSLIFLLSIQTYWFQTKWVWERHCPLVGATSSCWKNHLRKMKCVRAGSEEIAKLFYSLPLLNSSSSLQWEQIQIQFYALKTQWRKKTDAQYLQSTSEEHG